MTRTLLALLALISACILPQGALAQTAPPQSVIDTGNLPAWQAQFNCAPRVPLKPIASVSAPGLTVSPGNAEFKASFTGAGIDLTGVDTQVLGDATTVDISDVKLQHTGGGHILVTGYDGGGNAGGNPTLNVHYFDFDFSGAQNLSQGNLSNNYTAGASHSQIHLDHGCLRNAPSDYFSTFLGGEFSLTDSFVAAMCRAAKIENGDHCEAGHINGGKSVFRNVMFDMSAGGGVPCCITGVLFFDAISTGYDIDATLDHCVFAGIQSQGFLYPIVLSPGHANVTLHISNCALEAGIHGQYIAGIGPYGPFNAKVLDEGGNKDLRSNLPIVLGTPAAPPPAADPRDAQISALTAQAGRYAGGLQAVIVKGAAANAKRAGPTKADMAAVIATAKTALSN